MTPHPRALAHRALSQNVTNKQRYFRDWNPAGKTSKIIQGLTPCGKTSKFTRGAISKIRQELRPTVTKETYGNGSAIGA